MTNLKYLTNFWDSHVADWLDGCTDLQEPLPRWFESYSGKGRGKVTVDGMPEPWIGDLTGPDHAQIVILGLNPGDYRHAFQARTGLYAEEVRSVGSYTKWASRNPYLLDAWRQAFGINRYHSTRQEFARRWLGNPYLPESSVILLELYPWHSTGVTGPMRPAADIVKRFIWEPIDDLTNVSDVFAFGKPWCSLIERLQSGPNGEQELALIDVLGKGGRSYGSSVESRSLRVYRRPSGKRIIVEWHSGSAGPPSATETSLLKDALS